MKQPRRNGHQTEKTIVAPNHHAIAHVAAPVAAPPQTSLPEAARQPAPAQTQTQPRAEPARAAERVENGWRSGRPVEDPAKTKAWGYVSAKPSEYLVHMRNGRVLTKSSGQGATCFKWRRDSVAIVPTSLQRLNFCADQVTLEKVGIAITGLAVFRIADPMLAFRVLNFSYPERAQEKLNATLSDMLIGATRRLVANLSVEECLQKRKAALANELLQEVAPVVGGEGRLDDGTDRGWGVVLDTIEIQQVRVQSATIFAQMQAPYRTDLERKASIARSAFAKESRLRQAKDQQEVDAAELERARAVDFARAQVAKEKSDREKALALLQVQNKSEVEQKSLEEASVLDANRAEVTRRAAAQKLANDRALSERRAEAARLVELQSQEHSQAVAERRLAQDAALKLQAETTARESALREIERLREVDLQSLRRRAELAEREAELAAEIATRDAQRDLDALEFERVQHLAWLDVKKVKEEEQAAQDALASATLAADLERDAMLNASSHAQKLRDVEILQRRADVATKEAAARAQLLVAEKMPELAAAVGQRFGEIKLTQIGGDGGGLNVAPAVSAFGEMLQLAKQAITTVGAPVTEAPDDDAKA